MTATWLNGAEADARPALDLRALGSERGIAVAGAWDGISAVLAKRAGFRALYLSGAALSASMALPDLGLTTLEDVSARRPHRGARLRPAAHRRCRYRFRRGAERDARGARAGIGRRRRHPDRGPAIPQEMRPPQRQAPGLHRRHVPQDLRRQARRHHHGDLRAHRCGGGIARRRHCPRPSLHRCRRRHHLRRGDDQPRGHAAGCAPRCARHCSPT